ncbi:carbohydrate binding-domain-containing protein [Triangularia verruculosa]|uniref:Carbohydrate binding-domain-containing protein n=1 Tax=Triangularia verruculosa TaxID=2587418 RepID=A0AAN6XHV3_9PEZI|nr:carbohydrate binding-domain-containing protein [Triangularia verruculosa]
MTRFTLAAAALIGLSHGAAAALQQCGPAQYDPANYVCWENQFLCPVTAGEGLSYCNGACYSKFMYTCNNNILALLPTAESAFTLTVSNPALPLLDGKPVTAQGLRLWLSGETKSYCPSVVDPNCPPGNVTSIAAGGYGGASMNTMVPGGQQVYLTPDWNVGYTQAHSAYIPPGSTSTGFAAYQGGGFINLNGNGWGWVACPPRASGPAGPEWTLYGRNSTNAESLNYCTPINLKVTPYPGQGAAAWQYT